MIRDLSLAEMKCVSGGHINGQHDPSLLAAGILGDIGGAIWGGVNSVIGLGIGFTGFAIDHAFGNGDATISISGSTIQFGNNPLMVSGSALTLGNVQIYSVGLTGKPGTIAHENAHTKQSNMLGPFYLIAWAGGAILAGINGGSPFGEGNPMERGPYSNPPTPF
ncbi:MAG: hypothetical protein V3U57_04395 [Robiginitomaculum sp.]